jgi:hypothetical protein
MTLSIVTNGSPSEAAGLGAVLCYDPYFSRMVQSVRQTLADGHPILVRLHPAAQYPAPHATALVNDLESHAVLIVGYDDGQQAFAIADPWSNEMFGGSRGGVRWMQYEELALTVVNSTKDCYQVLSPLDVKAEADDTHLNVSVGFYEPDGIVMDSDSLSVRRVTVRVGQHTATSEGKWRVGERATLQIPLELAAIANSETATVSVEAVVGANRPYPFEDVVTTQCVAHTRAARQRRVAGAAH